MIKQIELSRSLRPGLRILLITDSDQDYYQMNNYFFPNITALSKTTRGFKYARKEVYYLTKCLDISFAFPLLCGKIYAKKQIFTESLFHGYYDKF